MGKSTGQRLKVWTWSGRDRSSLDDLEFVVALHAQKELQQASVRLALPKPDIGYRLVRSNEHRFDLAAAAPGRVFWRDLDSLHDDEAWQHEDALEDLRASSQRLELRNGRWAEPVQRSKGR